MRRYPQICIANILCVNGTKFRVEIKVVGEGPDYNKAKENIRQQFETMLQKSLESGWKVVKLNLP